MNELPKLTLRWEDSQQSDFGPCPDCGQWSRRVWGEIRVNRELKAVCYVHWTLGRSEHPAGFDFIVGGWGDHTSPADRVVVALLYRNDIETRGFMVVDADGRLSGNECLAGRALRRDEVVGKPLAAEIFRYADAVLLSDPRVGPIETLPPTR